MCNSSRVSMCLDKQVYYVMNNVLIFSKSTLFRNCLVNFVKDFDNVDSVTGVETLPELENYCDRKRPDFVIADVYSRNTDDDVIDFIKMLIDSSRIIIITTAMSKQLNFYENVYGITKFVYADESMEEITKCLCSAFNGHCVCMSKTSSVLTPRECEILKMIAKGKTSKEIADDLCISKNTVDTHRNKMLQKLNMTNSASLVQFAHSAGLI